MAKVGDIVFWATAQRCWKITVSDQTLQPDWINLPE
jgi:hypothetical protein